MRSELQFCAAALLGCMALAGLPAIATPQTPAKAPPPAPSIQVKDAWIRWLPAGVPAGGYATLINTGEKPVTLIGVSSAVFAEIMIHRSMARAGIMEMSPVKRITIEPHAILDFAASGYHLMLMQPSVPLVPGSEVPITLRFADGGELTVQFEVRK